MRVMKTLPTNVGQGDLRTSNPGSCRREEEGLDSVLTDRVALVEFQVRLQARTHNESERGGIRSQFMSSRAQLRFHQTTVATSDPWDYPYTCPSRSLVLANRERCQLAWSFVVVVQLPRTSASHHRCRLAVLSLPTGVRSSSSVRSPTREANVFTSLLVNS